MTETPHGIVTETVVTGGAEDGGGGAGGGEGGDDDRDEEAALCLGSRSAVHFANRDFEECIKDIDVSKDEEAIVNMISFA